MYPKPMASDTSNDRTTSFITKLDCSGCGEKYSPDEIHTFCPTCQSPLLARYDLETIRSRVDRDEFRMRQGGMWRWRELLPVKSPQNLVSLGEGDTALVHLPRLGKELGLSNLFVKDESSNPTGSFKARGLAAAISKAKELGIEKVIIPTAGNAGGAMAAYAARAGNSVTRSQRPRRRGPATTTAPSSSARQRWREVGVSSRDATLAGTT